MNFKGFITEKLLTISLLIFALISIEIFLMAYPVGNFIKIYIPIIIIVSYFIGLFCEYFSKRRYYKNLQNILDELDEKYLITEIIKTPDFIEGKILKDTLEQIDKSMNENVNKYKYLQEDYKEYIELWIHEIKIPIAASKMVIENNKDSVTKSIDEELEKVENYIEQALFYARSNTVEKDYYIKKSNLKEIVNESIKKNKSVLIQEKVGINAHDLDVTVNTDSKWIVFILNQIIQNSVKYRNKDVESNLEIYSKQGKENVILYIKDNGIGIKKGEIARVFEKGFTGTNGRLSGKKSTGIGLYLCKKLCDKLGIAIELNSIRGVLKMENVLEVKNIEKYYGSKSNLTKAVDNISFNIKSEEFVGIMGASGSGKTTLLNCISTIDRVTSGHIIINGEDITKLKCIYKIVIKDNRRKVWQKKII